jgi:hypothetical protein
MWRIITTAVIVDAVIVGSILRTSPSEVNARGGSLGGVRGYDLATSRLASGGLLAGGERIRVRRVGSQDVGVLNDQARVLCDRPQNFLRRG